MHHYNNLKKMGFIFPFLPCMSYFVSISHSDFVEIVSPPI